MSPNWETVSSNVWCSMLIQGSTLEQLNSMSTAPKLQINIQHWKTVQAHYASMAKLIILTEKKDTFTHIHRDSCWWLRPYSSVASVRPAKVVQSEALGLKEDSLKDFINLRKACKIRPSSQISQVHVFKNRLLKGWLTFFSKLDCIYGV